LLRVWNFILSRRSKKDFLPQYKNCMAEADLAFVYFSPEVVHHKKLEEISADLVRDSFGTSNITVFYGF